MDVIINKRKIRNTVKQMVDNGRKNWKQENRSYRTDPVFPLPGLTSNALGGYVYKAAVPFIAVRPF